MKQRTVIRIEGDGTAILPAEVLRALGLDPGEAACVLTEDQRLIVLREDESPFRGHPYASWRDISHGLLDREEIKSG